MRNICINIFVLSIVVLFFTTCQGKSNYIGFEDDSINTKLIHTPYVAINILNKDSVYKVVIEESDIPIFTAEKRRNVLYPVFRNDTIEVDDKTFDLLKDRCTFVISQSHIDSIFNGYPNNIVDILFDKYGKHHILKGTFSDEEQRYLIYRLFQLHIYLMTDCESGDLYIVNY